MTLLSCNYGFDKLHLPWLNDWFVVTCINEDPCKVSCQWAACYTGGVMLHSGLPGTLGESCYTVGCLLHWVSHVTQWAACYTGWVMLHSGLPAILGKSCYTVGCLLHWASHITQWADCYTGRVMLHSGLHATLASHVTQWAACYTGESCSNHIDMPIDIIWSTKTVHWMLCLFRHYHGDIILIWVQCIEINELCMRNNLELIN